MAPLFALACRLPFSILIPAASRQAPTSQGRQCCPLSVTLSALRPHHVGLESLEDPGLTASRVQALYTQTLRPKAGCKTNVPHRTSVHVPTRQGYGGLAVGPFNISCSRGTPMQTQPATRSQPAAYIWMHSTRQAAAAKVTVPWPAMSSVTSCTARLLPCVPAGTAASMVTTSPGAPIRSTTRL